MASALMNSQLVGSNHLLVQRAVVNGEGDRSRRLMRSRRSWIAGSLDDDAYTGADSTSAEDVLQGAGESREDILTPHRVVAPQNREAPVLAVDPRVASLGIDDPHDPRPGGEPVRHLGEDLCRSVVGRQDFGKQIGRQLSAATLANDSHALTCDEGDIGGPHRIRIRADLEAGVLTEHQPEALVMNEAPQEVRQFCRDSAVPGAWWLAHD